MAHSIPYREHGRKVLILGLPLIGSHVAQFAITLTDAIMLGWYSVDALAAEVLGGTLFFIVMIMGSGFAQAVMPMVASAQASGHDAQVRRVTRMGAWASIIYALAFFPVMFWSNSLFLAMGQDAGVSKLASQYLTIAGPAVLPALLVMVLKSYLAALERTQVVLWVTLAAVGLNVLVNYALIFGNWGMPEMGIRGAAVASLAVNIASVIALAIYAAWATPEHALFHRVWRPDWEALGQVFRLGWPIGLTMLAETGLFAAATTMMGWLGKVELAAHGIAIQLAALTFMVHLGLSNAATIRAGQAYGRGDADHLAKGAKVVTVMSVLFAAVTMVIFLVFPEPLIGLFMSPDEPERDAVLAVGVFLLAAAALFQLFDGLQVMALGLLRGLQDTRAPMVIAAISYWVIGVPVSYVLGFNLGFGGVGIWIGLAIGLACAAVFLMARFWGWTIKTVSGDG